MTQTLLREFREDVEVVERNQRVLHEVQEESGRVELWHEGVKVDDVATFTGVRYALEEAPDVVERFRITPDSSLHVRVQSLITRALYYPPAEELGHGYRNHGKRVGFDWTVSLSHVWDSHAGAMKAGTELRIPFRKSIFLGVNGPAPSIDPGNPGIQCRRIDHIPTQLLWDGWSFGGVADEALSVVRLDGRPGHLERSRETFDGWYRIDLKGTWGVSPPAGVSREQVVAVIKEQGVEPDVLYSRESWPKWYANQAALYVGHPAAELEWG